MIIKADEEGNSKACDYIASKSLDVCMEAVGFIAETIELVKDNPSITTEFTQRFRSYRDVYMLDKMGSDDFLLTVCFAEHGYSGAQYAVGIFYGLDNENRHEQCVKYLKMAAANGHEEAKKKLKEMGE